MPDFGAKNNLLKVRKSQREILVSSIPPKSWGSVNIAKKEFPLHVSKVFDIRSNTFVNPFHTALLVFIDFCTVQSDFFTWSYVTKTFAILPANIIEYQI